MKDDFMKQFFDDDKNSDHEQEIGVAINEQPQANMSQNPRDKQDDDDFLFSSHDNEPEEEEEYEEGGEGEHEKSGLAYAQSSKERFIDKIKGNLIYVFIALILIVPGAMKLYNLITGGGNATPTQQERNLSFSETTPAENVPVETTTPAKTGAATEVAPAKKPAKTEQVSTTKPAENAARSTTEKAAVVGSGSEATSGNMPVQNEEKVEKPAAGIAASILGTSGQAGGSEQILDRYFAQESQVEQQLSDLLGRLDDIEAKLAVLDDMDKRLTALENNKTALSNEQLDQVLKRISQLEQNVNQLKQQPKAPPVTQAAAAPKVANQPRSNAAAAGISVEAVIPGRAWVRNRDGVLMVVEVGDEIPGVGKVTRIDAREGIVATTTQIFKQ